jgi:tRNA uridine 5-carboxymethylaminomethyl modification enzyme
MKLNWILDKFLPSDIFTDSNLTAAMEIELKFDGYLRRQDEEISKLKKSESDLIPESFNYDAVPSLKIEAREKLKQVKPYSLGQAMRIPGVTPTAISLLAIHLKRQRSGYRQDQADPR